MSYGLGYKLGYGFRSLLGGAALALLAACTPPTQPMTLAPFADRPTETFRFSHQMRPVDGTVWIFEDHGGYFGSDIPVATGAFNADGGMVHNHVPSPGVIWERTTVSAVVMDPAPFPLEDFADLKAVAPDRIVALIKAVARYCDETGYVRPGDGALLQVQSGKLLFVYFCFPPGMVPPT